MICRMSMSRILLMIGFTAVRIWLLKGAMLLTASKWNGTTWKKGRSCNKNNLWIITKHDKANQLSQLPHSKTNDAIVLKMYKLDLLLSVKSVFFIFFIICRLYKKLYKLNILLRLSLCIHTSIYTDDKVCLWIRRCWLLALSPLPCHNRGCF